jgi:K+-transporting ATPase ATPase C chain
MKTTLRPLLVLFLALSFITGLAYPLLVTALGQALYPAQAAGSLIVKDGKPVGSALIGQNFSDPGHFWGRPSATGPQPNNAAASSGSNQGPLNPALVDAVKGRVQTLHDADPGNNAAVPVDLVTASASGLDPHISLAAARYQVSRVAAARKLDAARVQALVEQFTERPLFGLLGEPGVNVLRLNLALEEVKP